jgi:dehydrogenase/reductase SDR family member 7B
MQPTQHFKDQVVIVTGASSGIGKAAAMAFGAAGARVALIARSSEPLAAVAAQMQALGQSCMAVPCDVTDQRQVEAMAQSVVASWGRIDILVNNAGIGAHGPFLSVPFPDFERIMRVNLFGAVYCTSAALRQMIPQQSGKIINVSSMIGKRAYPGNAAYCSSKFALEGFTESLRTEVRHQGIHVILICPGLTETAFFDHLLQDGGNRKPGRPGMSPDKVAAILLDAARRNAREAVITWRAKILVLFDKTFPALLERLLQARFRSRYSERDQTRP